jgi:hypothetical protein
MSLFSVECLMCIQDLLTRLNLPEPLQHSLQESQKHEVCDISLFFVLRTLGSRNFGLFFGLAFCLFTCSLCDGTLLLNLPLAVGKLLFSLDTFFFDLSLAFFQSGQTFSLFLCCLIFEHLLMGFVLLLLS